jgi:hypothetical protein
MPSKTISFRIGDVLDADDDLAVWFCTIALAHNDLVITNVREIEADSEWQRFYDWRMGVGHYSEVMLFLGRMRDHAAITSFIDSSPSELQQAYKAALDEYEGTRRVAKHVRNEAAFHYPSTKGVRAMRRALRDPELTNTRGGVTSRSGKVRDTRMHYADEVMAKMVMNAAGGRMSSRKLPRRSARPSAPSCSLRTSPTTSSLCASLRASSTSREPTAHKGRKASRTPLRFPRPGPYRG